MLYNLKELENKYKVKLDDTQKEVLSSLINFIDSDNQTICLQAPAGCGKTQLLSMLYDVYTNNDLLCAFVAPTNKAKLVITDKGDSDRTSLTIHSLLNLRPNIDILEFDASQLLFEVKVANKIEHYDVLLIDECSMINDDLYETLCSRFYDSKIIFSGDESQLSPVNQDHKSKTFNTEILRLTKIYRQPDSKLHKVLEYLRHKPLYTYKNVSDDNGNLIVCNNILEMISKYSYLFKLCIDLQDSNLVKLITYTNNRITALNNLIREMLYQDKEEYHIGEVLTGYDSCDFYQEKIHNSKDYIVKRVIKVMFKYGNNQLPAYKLRLFDGNNTIDIIILSKICYEQELLDLTVEIETLRQKAVRSKLSKDWATFYKLYNSFLTPKDLILNNRVIKRKSLDYGYCISAHKSQSSSYSVVMIDMENILRCSNPKELRQLQYVACSRTIGDLIIYQKD